MRSLCAPANLGLLYLHEITDTRFLSDLGPRAKTSKRADSRRVMNRAVFYDARIPDRDLIADLDILQSRPRLHCASGANPARALDDYLRVNHCIGANGDVLIYVGS